MQINSSTFKEFLLNFIIPLIAIAATGALGFFILYPSYTALEPTRAELSTKKALHNQLNSKLTTLHDLVEFKAVVDENASLVHRVIPDEAAVPFLLTQIDLIAKEAGLEVTKMSYTYSTPTKTTAPQPTSAEISESDETAEKSPKYLIVDVLLGATGNLDQLQEFFNKIETSARYVDIDTFRFEAENEQDGEAVSGSSRLAITFGLRAPHIRVQSNAVTDDPIDLNISDDEFLGVINTIKGMKYYDITEESINQALLEETRETTESTS